MNHGQLDAPWHYAMADYAEAGAPYGYGHGALKRWYEERERGRVTCPECWRTLHVRADDLLVAREELRDEGWVETVAWDGEDRTALAHWVCCASAGAGGRARGERECDLSWRPARWAAV